MRLRIAIDVGGTFTDGVLLNEADGRIWLAKSLTSYGNPGDAIAHVSAALLKQFGQASDVVQIVHGTTLITNSLIERKGVRTALITNAGLRDVLDIRRELRYDTYDLTLTYPKPLVAICDRYEISARIGPDGTEWAALDEAEARELLKEILASGAGALAICLLHSPVDGSHEKRLGEIVAEVVPNLPVTLSSEVSGEIGEYERMSTTTANAFVQPMVRQYVNELKARFKAVGVQARLDIMVSSGAFTTDKQVSDFPIRLLESGPAGGVLSAINCAAAHDIQRVLAFDMGGTTAKSCVALNGVPEITHSFEFAREKRFKKGSGLPATTPSIDLIEIGAGGGSIAFKNALGLMQVGPQSAGSEPGPACYGLGGTDATVTDADVALGYLDPDGFLGGAMHLDRDSALEALARIGTQVGLDAIGAAHGIHEIVNENMAAAARAHIAEKGLDARDFTLVATGGAGPVHGVDVARRLRISRILCPIASGVGSCLGFLAAPARADRTWTKVESFDGLNYAAFAGRIKTALAEIGTELAQMDTNADDIVWRGLVEARYVGQGANVEIAFDPHIIPNIAALTEAFDLAYIDVFGRTVPGGIPEALTWRVWGSIGGGVRKFVIGTPVTANTSVKTRKLFISAYNDFRDVPVYPRDVLEAGAKLCGPCVITENESTIVVAYDADVIVLNDRSIEIRLDEVST